MRGDIMPSAESNLSFIEHYESKMKELQLLTILKADLTGKGLETYNKINQYLTENLDKYMNASQNNGCGA